MESVKSIQSVQDIQDVQEVKTFQDAQNSGVTILIDIDGVLACHKTSRLLQQYNKTLQLAIPNSDLNDITEDAFYQLPQVQTYREKIGEDKFLWRTAALKFHPDYVIDHEVIEGALFATKYLSKKVADLGYCTARYINFDDRWNKQLAATTKLWLKNHDFPHYSQILFCDGIQAKLQGIADILREHEETAIMLIDDSAEKLIAAFTTLSEEDQSILLDRFTLVAFSYERCDDTALRTVPFPDWGKVFDLCVEKEFNYAKKQKAKR